MVSGIRGVTMFVILSKLKLLCIKYCGYDYGCHCAKLYLTTLVQSLSNKNTGIAQLPYYFIR